MREGDAKDSDVLDQEPAAADSPAAAPARAEHGGPESWNLDSLPPELDYFRSSAAYQIELTGFQGPLDLLLYLIDRDQVDIYDIPIARITEQFMRHIEVMQSISLDQAGEFIAMAATLLVIKMKMLMPSHADELEEQEEDPRAELVRRLLEYKRFKDAAQAFQSKDDERRQYHTRQLRFPFTSDLAVEPALRIEMFDLLAALAGIYDRVRKRPVHDIVREPFTVGEKIDLIAMRTGDGSLVRFEELFKDDAIKMEVVVTFIAILEMVKRGRLVFVQTEPLGPIWLQRPAPGTVTGTGETDVTLENAMSHASLTLPATNLEEEPRLEPTAAEEIRLAGDDDDEEAWGDEDQADDDDDDDDDIEWEDEDDEEDDAAADDDDADEDWEEDEDDDWDGDEGDDGDDADDEE